MVNIKPKTDHKEEKPEKNELEDWKNKYLRALADYQNLERRIREKEIQDKKYATREAVLRFLPVIDDLVKAQELLKNDGLALILDKFVSALKSEGVEKKDCLNSKYDENIMECVSIVEGEKDDWVIGQVRPAYLMDGEVIRTAQVVVSKINNKEKVSAKSGSASG